MQLGISELARISLNYTATPPSTATPPYAQQVHARLPHTERVTSEQSAARQALFGGEAAGVKKRRSRGKQPNSKQRQNQAKAKAAGQQQPGKTD